MPDDEPSPAKNSTKNDVYAFSTALPPSFLPSVSHASMGPQAFGDLNDDDDLENLIFHVHGESQRLSNRMNEYTKFANVLMDLK